LQPKLSILNCAGIKKSFSKTNKNNDIPLPGGLRGGF
jgi:hypothetical protein